MNGKNYPVKNQADERKERIRLDKKYEKLTKSNKKLDEEIKELEGKRDALVKKLEETKAKRAK